LRLTVTLASQEVDTVDPKVVEQVVQPRMVVAFGLLVDMLLLHTDSVQLEVLDIVNSTSHLLIQSLLSDLTPEDLSRPLDVVMTD
jgi:hypothetical protein